MSFLPAGGMTGVGAEQLDGLDDPVINVVVVHFLLSCHVRHGLLFYRLLQIAMIA